MKLMGKGMAMQFNYLTDKGAFVENPDGTFARGLSEDQAAVRDLVHDLLAVEANGDMRGEKDASTSWVDCGRGWRRRSIS